MKTNLFLLVFFLFSHSIIAQPSERVFVKDVSEPVISLNGTWEINLNPSGNFWEEDQFNNEWHDIQVPGEVMIQGYPVRHDQSFVYRKCFKIPSDFEGKTVKIRFEGVYSYARVWINGSYLRDHHGGFTPWECNITSNVLPGDTARLTVEVTDRKDEISYASGYAKHPIGGLLRNVNLLALPTNYLEDITIKTDLDENFQHAFLKVAGQMKGSKKDAEIKLELFDDNNTSITLEDSIIELENESTFQLVNQINNPEKWDAEHPNLYCLRVSYIENDRLQWQRSYKIGFREITVLGNEFLVNGKEVKLRGACRHDIHPLLGRVSTPEYELKDVMLAKESNMNFIRTSHYPPTEHFLKLCDQYGLYVEVETAVCFVGTHRTKLYLPAATQNDPDFQQRYLSQLDEMVTTHKNHPSVIIWSIGNENLFGTNFKKSYDWVKKNDNTRPVIFSYPGHVPDSIKSYDILSMHYPDIKGSMDQYGIKTEGFTYDQMPVLFDEWAHVACYNHSTVKEDPNIRDFWGRSLDLMWRKIFEAKGGLGGAIWGMVDETFMLPESLPGYNIWWGNIDKNVVPAEYAGPTIGYGEWGIVDTWRRKKPEFWNTKKAYSPVKLLKTDFEQYTKGKPLSVPLYNRFDHTNIQELRINLIYNNQIKILNAPYIEAHAKGNLEIPIYDWSPSKPVFIEFFDRNERLIDKYTLHLNPSGANPSEHIPDHVISMEERGNLLHVICANNTRILFNKKTGLIQEIQRSLDTITVSGPYINLRTKGDAIRNTYHEINNYCKSWTLKDFKYQEANQYVTLNVTGNYDTSLPVNLMIIVNANGEIKIRYEIDNVPKEYIREIGVRFEMEDTFDSLLWIRNGYWSFYPPKHLSSETGITSLYTHYVTKYRTPPEKNWNLESKSFFYDGIEEVRNNDQLTYIARSTKENVVEYSLMKNQQVVLSVPGDGQLSCRIIKKNGNIHLYANNAIDYIDLAWGNYQNNIILPRNYANDITLSIR